MTPLDKYDITSLLATKPFAELTPEERQFALAELGSKQAYEEMYAIVNGAQQMDDMTPSNSMRSNVMNAFDASQNKEHKVIPIFAKKRNKLIAMLASAAVLTIVFLAGLERMNNHNNELAEARSSKEIKSQDSTNTTTEKPTKEATTTAQEQETETTIESLKSVREETTTLKEPSQEADIAEAEVVADLAVGVDEVEDIALAEPALESTAKMDTPLEYELHNALAAAQEDTEEEQQAAEESKDAAAFADSAPTRLKEDAEILTTSAVASGAEGVGTRSLKKASNMGVDKTFTLKVAIPPSTHYTSY